MAPRLRRRQSLDEGADNTGRAAADKSDSTLDAWKAQYPLPDESSGDSGNEVVQKYRPPRNDAKGVAIACSVIAAWAVLFYHGCFQVVLTPGPERSHWLDIVATFLLLEFVNTGLNRTLNDWIGRVAINLYAWFDYGMLHRKHWEHHNLTGQKGKDPDFHSGNPHFLAWFGRFMWQYATLWQFSKILLISQVLQAAGVPYANLCVYMAAAPILAAVRLFYFGTFLPHLPHDADEVMNWQKSHSLDDPTWLSFLKCYNFGYHWEHHRWPYAPWWELPKAKQITREWHRQQEAQQVQQ
ncbi:beta-carotene ketolase [Scenedesmus sp. NREL 46B-D3]|nr:beta-carotene ketolase [Scenedesmus sp. NREL 46B-D3]